MSESLGLMQNYTGSNASPLAILSGTIPERSTGVGTYKVAIDSGVSFIAAINRTSTATFVGANEAIILANDGGSYQIATENRDSPHYWYLHVKLVDSELQFITTKSLVGGDGKYPTVYWPSFYYVVLYTPS